MAIENQFKLCFSKNRSIIFMTSENQFECCKTDFCINLGAKLNFKLL